jgi:hypothetical protein
VRFPFTVVTGTASDRPIHRRIGFEYQAHVLRARSAEANVHLRGRPSPSYADGRDENGRRLVPNGSHQTRKMLTPAGAIDVVAPRVNDKRVDAATGERRRCSSAILPSWTRKTSKITEMSPLLYLHGGFSSDFVPALGQFLDSPAGSPASVIIQLTE